MTWNSHALHCIDSDSCCEPCEELTNECVGGVCTCVFSYVCLCVRVAACAHVRSRAPRSVPQTQLLIEIDNSNRRKFSAMIHPRLCSLFLKCGQHLNTALQGQGQQRAHMATQQVCTAFFVNPKA